MSFFSNIFSSPEKRGRRLIKAISCGDTQKALLLIEEDTDVYAKNEDGLTALHLASEKGYLEIAQLLIEKRSDINAKNQRRETPLHLASEKGYLEIAQLLIEKGADSNAKQKNGVTALQLALFYKNPPLVKLLTEKDADVNAKTNNELTKSFEVKATRREKRYFEKEHKAEIKYKIEAEHKNIIVNTYDYTPRHSGAPRHVSPKFPTSLCASCGTSGNFRLEKQTWNTFQMEGFTTLNSFSLPRCPICSSLNVEKPTGRDDNRFRHLHSIYVEAIRIANPSIDISLGE